MTLEIPLHDIALFNLGRHHLLERVSRSRAIEVIDDILGLNAQGAMNVQLSLLNRVDGLDTGFIPRALNIDRSLVKTWLMRDTVHIIPSQRFRLFQGALESSLLREWNRWTVKTGVKASSASWEPFYREILRALDGGPLTIRQMLKALSRFDMDPSMLTRLVREMSLCGLVCHAEASGPWHHTTENSFAGVEKWLPRAFLDPVSEDEARRRLALKYLEAYGPASVQDFAYWMGLSIKESRSIFHRISDSITEVLVKGRKDALLTLEEDASDLLNTQERYMQARLLPGFDALIMGHRDKARFLDPEFRGKIFLPRGDVAPTMLIGGRVRGVWKLRKSKDVWKLELSPFKALTSEEIEEVEVEVDRLRRFTSFEIRAAWIQDERS